MKLEITDVAVDCTDPNQPKLFVSWWDRDEKISFGQVKIAFTATRERGGPAHIAADTECMGREFPKTCWRPWPPTTDS